MRYIKYVLEFGIYETAICNHLRVSEIFNRLQTQKFKKTIKIIFIDAVI